MPERDWCRTGRRTHRAEIRDVYTDAIRAAERFIYIETQYFTSRSIAAALVERLSDGTKPPLTLLIVLPRGADSQKEKFALGEMQAQALGTIEEAGRSNAQIVYILCSQCDESRATFVHSKLLLVDDEFLSVASANFTERSMGIDSELALLWDAQGKPELVGDIGRVRASLLAEHAGREPSEFLRGEELAERVGALVLPGASRLRACHHEPVPANPLKTLISNPGGPLSVSEAERLA